MVSLGWTSAHTKIKGKTAKKEFVLTRKAMCVTSVQAPFPWHILPAETLPCMLMLLVPILRSALPRQGQQPEPLAELWTVCFGSLAVMLNRAATLQGLVSWYCLYQPWGHWASSFLKFAQCLGFLFQNFIFFKIYFIAHWKRNLCHWFCFKKQKHNYSEMNSIW